jgi:predicted SAM-dependent methyltransferase
MNIYERFSALEKPRLYSHGFSQTVWRIFGYLGNKFFQSYPPQKNNSSKINLLNLGSGSLNHESFVNADFYRLHKIWSKNRPDWMLDITRPMKCHDNYWDGVLIEHTNEHILYTHNYVMLSELYRTMKPGGVLRIIVPDLDKYLEWDKLRETIPKMNRYHSLPEAICNLTQNHLHVSVWNFKLMSELLNDIGFVDIVKTSFMNGSLNELLVDSENHEWQSLYLEAKKPY